MDRTHWMTAFVAVAEERSFAAAARRLGLSPASVTRAIASLEAHLGVKLVARTTRSVRLTDVAGPYLDDVRAVLARMTDAQAAALAVAAGAAGADGGVHGGLRGHLNVAAPALLGAQHVVPCIAEYQQRYPDMGVSGYFLDRVVDLADEGMDVAVRIGPGAGAGVPSGSQPLGWVRRVLCASPAYLAAHGTPQHPQDLARHVLVAATGVSSPGAAWPFATPAGPLVVPVAPRLVVTTNDAALQAAVLGVGIARLLSYQVAAAVRDGQLQVVLAPYEEPPWPIHLVHGPTPGGAVPPKVRAFMDIVARHAPGWSVV